MMRQCRKTSGEHAPEDVALFRSHREIHWVNCNSLEEGVVPLPVSGNIVLTSTAPHAVGAPADRPILVCWEDRLSVITLRGDILWDDVPVKVDLRKLRHVQWGQSNTWILLLFYLEGSDKFRNQWVLNLNELTVDIPLFVPEVPRLNDSLVPLIQEVKDLQSGLSIAFAHSSRAFHIGFYSYEGIKNHSTNRYELPRGRILRWAKAAPLTFEFEGKRCVTVYAQILEREDGARIDHNSNWSCVTFRFELQDKSGGGFNIVEVCTSGMGPIDDLEMKWSPSGRFGLLIKHFWVDKTGANYGTTAQAYLVDASQPELSPEELTDSGSILQDIAWAPSELEHKFIVITGKGLSDIREMQIDEASRVVSLSQTLPNGYRNTILYHSSGELLAIGGYKQLAGDTTIYTHSEGRWCEVKTTRLACTVVPMWSPSGNFFISATVAPRMRIDNGVKILSNSGEQRLHWAREGGLYILAAAEMLSMAEKGPLTLPTPLTEATQEANTKYRPKHRRTTSELPPELVAESRGWQPITKKNRICTKSSLTIDRGARLRKDDVRKTVSNEGSRTEGSDQPNGLVDAPSVPIPATHSTSRGVLLGGQYVAPAHQQDDVAESQRQQYQKHMMRYMLSAQQQQQQLCGWGRQQPGQPATQYPQQHQHPQQRHPVEGEQTNMQLSVADIEAWQNQQSMFYNQMNAYRHAYQQQQQQQQQQQIHRNHRFAAMQQQQAYEQQVVEYRAQQQMAWNQRNQGHQNSRQHYDQGHPDPGENAQNRPYYGKGHPGPGP